MATILSADEVADIRDSVAPELSDELVSVIEVWRMPGAGSTPVVGGSGVGGFGTEVEEGADPDRPDQKRGKFAEYPARISRAGTGREAEAGLQVVSVKQYTLSFNWADEPDIRGGDRLLEQRAEWESGKGYFEGDTVQPTASNGRFYVCKTAGLSGVSEPVWNYPVYPAKTAADNSDGGVMWKYGGYLRTFEVVDPGGETTYKITRLVRGEEIIS